MAYRAGLAVVLATLAAGPALAQDVVIRPGTSYEVTVIEEPAAPPVVVRPRVPRAEYETRYLYVDAEDGCTWLRHRAERTGDGYWWARYRDCTD